MPVPRKTTGQSSFQALCDHFGASWQPTRWCHVTVIAAVSGGADSIFLLRAMEAIKRVVGGSGRLVVAHFNHGVRGDEADRDQAFVADLAESLDLDFQTEQAATPESTMTRPTDEATLRAQRYAFLARLAHRVGARYVVTGHTLDDNVETVLHHLFRGTGPSGMGGISPHRELATDVILRRPLLEMRRSEMRDALRSIGQIWHEDATNRDTRWKRNWIRKTLLPLIEEQYPSVAGRIGTAVSSQRALVGMLDQLAEPWLRDCCQISWKPDGSAESVRMEPPSVDRVVLIHGLRRLWDQARWPRGSMTETQWCKLCETIQDRSASSIMLPGAINVSWQEGRLTLRRPERLRDE